MSFTNVSSRKSVWINLHVEEQLVPLCSSNFCSSLYLDSHPLSSYHLLIPLSCSLFLPPLMNGTLPLALYPFLDFTEPYWCPLLSILGVFQIIIFSSFLSPFFKILLLVVQLSWSPRNLLNTPCIPSFYLSIISLRASCVCCPPYCSI